MLEDLLNEASRRIAESHAILIGAGAGFGVDSGLPDFRGDTGFWNAYPPYKKRGLSFIELANPKWFKSDPAFAWGFYGHRTQLYRQTQPHQGFSILKKWADEKQGGAFIMTSNVDGQFQKAGFSEDQIFECHGSIHHHQCHLPDCPQNNRIWPFEGELRINDAFRADGNLPRCDCGAIARPNILMFNDGFFEEGRAAQQSFAYQQWLQRVCEKKFVVIEVGAGKAIPTIRYNSEQIHDRFGATVIRINPREAQGRDVLSLKGSALNILKKLDARLKET